MKTRELNQNMEIDSVEEAEEILKAAGTEDLFEKAHFDGEMHPNGKLVWRSSANNGKGDWRVAKKKKDNNEWKKEISSKKKEDNSLLKRETKRYLYEHLLELNEKKKGVLRLADGSPATKKSVEEAINNNVHNMAMVYDVVKVGGKDETVGVYRIIRKNRGYELSTFNMKNQDDDE